MVYNVNSYDNSNVWVVQDSTLNTTSTSLTLIGRNSVNFGLALNENFIALLQHFSNSSPPPNPLIGQIWYEPISSTVRVYNGTVWLVISPLFNGTSGTATVIATVGNITTIEVVIVICDQNIVSTITNTPLLPSQMLDYIVIADVNYPFKSRYPNGLTAGINLATDPAGYKFVGTSSSANVLASSSNIILSGAVTGSVSFNGSNDVTISTTLSTSFNSAISSGWYSNVYINSNGIVTDGLAIVEQDVINALGFTPPSQVVVIGDATGTSSANSTVFTVNVSLSNTTVTPGFYNNVTVDNTGRVIAGQTDYPIPTTGMILWTGITIPAGWAKCDGNSVVTSNGIITTPNLTNVQIGSTIFIMKIT